MASEHPVDDELPGHAGDRFLGRAVHVGDEHEVGAGDAGPSSRQSACTREYRCGCTSAISRRGSRRRAVATVTSISVGVWP